MADDPAAAPAPAPEPAPAPVEAAVVETAPTSILSAAAEPMEAPAAAEAPAPVVEASAEPEKIEAAPAPTDAPVELAPLTYGELKFPEGVTVPADDLKGYTDIFGKHQVPEAAVQELIDHHLTATQTALTRQTAKLVSDWESRNQGWVEQFVADTEIGGKNREATLARCGGVIQNYGGDATQQTELRTILAQSGVGNHPSVIRLLNNLGRVLGEGRPVPAVRAAAAPTKSSPRSRYSNSNS